MNEQIKIYQGDCIKVMDELINKGVKVDLVVTSPPYDNLRTYEDFEWDFNIFKEVANRLYNIIADNGVCVWVVNDATINGSETGTSFKQALYFKEIGFNLHDTMIYHKKGLTFPEFNRYYPCWEYMFILSKGKPKTTNLIKDRLNQRVGEKMTSTTFRNRDGILFEGTGSKNNRRIKKWGVRFNIWSYGTGYGKSAKNPIAHKHPAIFPLDLAKDHILSWSNPNDIILDPFMGSGTTGVACLQTGRRFIGIEKVEKYVDIAKERIGELDKQKKLI